MGERINFLVIAFNSLVSTVCCLESLVKYESGEEVLVLDNGSEEPIFSSINEKFSSSGVQVFRSERNLGVSGGRNFLLKKSSGKYLVFMDNDVELTGKVSEKVKEKLADRTVGAYGQRGLMFSLDLRSFVVRDKEVDAIAGFFQCFRKDLIGKIGLLDENFKVYGQEDFDFCLRAKKAGYKIIADSSLSLLHHKHKSSSTVVGLEDLKQKNYQYIFNKWKDSLNILEIERRGINRLSCLNCTETWERKKNL